MHLAHQPRARLANVRALVLRSLLFLSVFRLFSISAIAGNVAVTWNFPTDIPVTANSYTATGNTVGFTLNCVPAVNELTVINNIGSAFIDGRFSNLAQGQKVALSHAGETYHFVANYYGGSGNDLVLVWAGTRVFSWGANDSGKLGGATTTNSSQPAAVTTFTGDGALMGRTVVSVAAGMSHSLALCSDGTVAAWGANVAGQLGDGSTLGRGVPMAVNTAVGSALHGKTVVAISAGNNQSLALCSDGTVAAWGANENSQLGDGSSGNAVLPVLVNTAAGSALDGKTVVAVSAGAIHSLALCSDGTVAAWGSGYGAIPVALSMEADSALYGKTAVAVAAASYHEAANYPYSLVLCSDGTVAASVNGGVPVAVSHAGGSALSGRTVVAISAGGGHGLGLCSDGTLAAWEINDYGQLGDGTTENRSVPVAVNVAEGSALVGKTVAALSAGGWHSMALGTDGTLAAWGRNDHGELGDGGTTTSYLPVTVNRSALAADERFTRVSAGYSHNLALVSFPGDPSLGRASLSNLTLSEGVFSSAFASGTINYSVTVSSGTTSLTVRPTTADNATVSVNGTAVISGRSSSPLPLAVGSNILAIVVTSLDGNTTKTYTVTVNRPAETHSLNATWNSVTDVAVTTSHYTATGNTVGFTLNCVPAANELNVINNIGSAFIDGRFSNLAQGQKVALSHAGETYHFVANYYGGSGNDLVLVWAGTRVFSWGANDSGKLGDATTTNSSQPAAVTTFTGDGALMGRTVVSVATGMSHSLALCSDGTVAAWGANGAGQLGDGSTLGRGVPMAVNTAVGSALHGKTVVAISACNNQSLALCADGTVAAWGANENSQLGDGSSGNAVLPVLVNTAAGSALDGKTVVAVSAGAIHSLALCSDGTVAAWGSGYGVIPVALSMEADSALYGKTAVAVAAASYHEAANYPYSLVLCSDGTVAASVNGGVPVAVSNTGDSALSGRTVVAISAGGGHGLALCSSGTLAAWEINDYGQLGDGTTENRSVPVAVNVAEGSALNGKTVAAIAAGGWHSMALGTDGTLAAWGRNDHGELGDGGTTTSYLPVTVNRSALAADERFTRVSAGYSHNLALVSFPGDPSLGRASLSNLVLSEGVFSPAFASGTINYSVTVSSGATSLTVRPTTADNATVSVNGTAVISGRSSNPIPLAVGSNMLAIVVTALDGNTTKTYTVTVNRPVEDHSLNAIWNAVTDVPVTTSHYTATSSTIQFSLNCVPTCNDLMVIKNNGTDFIQGRFSNLAQGQKVALSHAGETYHFVANYYGGSGNDLVLVWAGTRVFSWGANDSGKLGDATTTNSSQPLAATTFSGDGVLLGKTVVSVAAGMSHSLALCSDGTVAAWGANGAGQLGDGNTLDRGIPMAVNTAVGSALHGKTVVAISACKNQSLALCSDGTVAAWGANENSQLGDGSSGNAVLPVLVNTAAGSALDGKTVVAVSAGAIHSLALCSDGTVAAWGSGYGVIPVALSMEADSALYGKTAVAVAAASYHEAANYPYSLVLCSDGTVAASVNGGVPVAVSHAGDSALSGRTVVAISAGGGHGLALCSSGTLAAWEINDYGQLGDGTTENRSVPVAVNAAEGSALVGKTVAAIAAGGWHSMALGTDGTLAAWGTNDHGELGDGGTTTSYLPVTVNRSALAADERFTRVSAGYSHNLALVSFPGDPSLGRASLSNLTLSEGVFSPAFASGTINYSVTVSSGATSLTVRPTTADNATVSVNGTAVISGRSSSPVPLAVGSNVLAIVVTSLDGNTTKTYTVTVNRPAETHSLNATWNSVTDVAVTTSHYTATGNTVSFTLNCVPAANELTVINNIGSAFIDGRFSNLAQGQKVALSHAGETYHFVANYYGGSGNDLVLVWAGTRVFSWGGNNSGQLGDATTTNCSQPAAVTTVMGDGALMGRTVVSVAAGMSHSLALCSDGTVAAWGANGAGQLGDGSTLDRGIPMAVNTAVGSALHGKTVVAISAGNNQSLALCSDGTVAAWGANENSQLGDGSSGNAVLPVLVNTAAGSALDGKTVVAVSAGAIHSLALCSDGTVAAWGSGYGAIPVALSMEADSALYGKTAVAVAAASYHEAANYPYSLVLCSDGTVAASVNGGVPVAVSHAGDSALSGRTVVAISAGGGHGLGLCSDGTLAAWEINDYGQLGDGTTENRSVPVAVNVAEGSALVGKTVAAIAAGAWHSMALGSDGTLAAWGTNDWGELGDGGTTTSHLPVAVHRGALAGDERFTRVSAGYTHNLALVSSFGPVPTCVTGSISELTKTSVRFSGMVNAHGVETEVSFQYGTDENDLSNKASTVPGMIYGSSNTDVTAQLNGLQKGTQYFYRIIATSRAGSVFGDTKSFITRTEPTASLGIAVALSTSSARVAGSINAHGSETQVFIDYGTNQGSLLYSAPANPSMASGYNDTPVDLVLSNLLQGTTYYFRIRGSSVAGEGSSLSGSFHLATLSGLNQLFPAAPPESRGSMLVLIYPPGISSAWRFVGEQQWSLSGDTIAGLTTADRMIEFRPVPGFIQPPQETVGVVSGEAATLLERTYYETPVIGSGELTVTLKPDALAAGTVPAETRAQWRLLGEDDAHWRDSEASLTNMTPGSYLIECKPVAGRTTPPATSVLIQNGQSAAPTITYSLADPLTGTQPNLIPFETVTTDQSKPYAHVGQIRSDVGSSSGFVVKPRVVATAGHVVFDDGSLSAVTGLQWLFQRHRGTYEPKPQIPRGYYVFDGYAAQRTAENTPGTSSPQSQNLDAAALYFLEDAGRGPATVDSSPAISTTTSSCFLQRRRCSSGYPVNGITISNQGQMHATPAMNAGFAHGFGRTFTTPDIRGSGGMSGGPLCIQHQNGT